MTFYQAYDIIQAACDARTIGTDSKASLIAQLNRANNQQHSSRAHKREMFALIASFVNDGRG